MDYYYELLTPFSKHYSLIKIYLHLFNIKLTNHIYRPINATISWN